MIAIVLHGIGRASSAKDREVRGVYLLYTINKGMADLSDGVVKGGGGEGQYGNRMVSMVAFEFDSLGWEASGARRAVAGEQ
jgi:hypothetical protein